MIKFKCRLSFRQYLPAKPIKWGIKMWALCKSDTGYACNMQVYTGKVEGHQEKRLAHRVCMDLLQPVLGTNLRVYMDNLYTSVGLLADLRVRGIMACGTVRANWKGLHFCPRPSSWSEGSSGEHRKTTWPMPSGWTPSLCSRCRTFTTQHRRAQCYVVVNRFALRCPCRRCWKITSSTCVESTSWTRRSATTLSTTARRNGGEEFSSTAWWFLPTMHMLSRRIRATRITDSSGRPSSTFSRTWQVTLLATHDRTELRSCLDSQHALSKHTHWRDCLQSDVSAESALSPQRLVREPKPLTMGVGSVLCLSTRSVWVRTSAEPTLVDSAHVIRWVVQ